MINEMIAWINFIILNISGILITYLYILSVTPATQEEKSNANKEEAKKIWKKGGLYRNIAGIFELIMIINLILWIWFPIPNLNWRIHPNFLIGIIIGIIILIPCLIILAKGVMDAGSETLQPSKNTKIYKGIYKYIRHPLDFDCSI
ncbi:MAG: hypothetical protein GF329_17640 [Candidatus Lokiarchaeota archaeon]|nr:hypothetical protein [Candidatus Lokiarchaeota archaeon]